MPVQSKGQERMPAELGDAVGGLVQGGDVGGRVGGEAGQRADGLEGVVRDGGFAAGHGGGSKDQQGAVVAG